MHKEEVKQIIMAILSGYLAYIGYGLLRDYNASQSAVYAVAGVLFLLFGAVSAVWYIRLFVLMKRGQAGRNGAEDETGEKADENDREH